MILTSLSKGLIQKNYNSIVEGRESVSLYHDGLTPALIDDLPKDTNILSDISDVTEIYSDDDPIRYLDIQTCFNIVSINIGGLNSKITLLIFKCSYANMTLFVPGNSF